MGDCGSKTELSPCAEEGMVEVDVTSLEEGKECANLLVGRDIFDKRSEGIPHCHVVGVGFMNEANWGLWVNGMI